MQWRGLAACAFLVFLVVPRADASDESPSSGRPQRLSVTFAAGPHLSDGGDTEAVSLGYTPWRGLFVLLNVERNHIPTVAHKYPDGYAATRGGTLTAITGELRRTVGNGKRISPFVFVGVGAGASHPNVNDVFSSPVTNLARVLYAGGGIQIPLRSALALCLDAKVLIFTERDVVGAMLPIRAGVTWRF